ncbi:hypothetical protein ADUPG1_012246, partial [Aduncisulcus paluster]
MGFVANNNILDDIFKKYLPASPILFPEFWPQNKEEEEKFGKTLSSIDGLSTSKFDDEESTESTSAEILDKHSTKSPKQFLSPIPPPALLSTDPPCHSASKQAKARKPQLFSPKSTDSYSDFDETRISHSVASNCNSMNESIHQSLDVRHISEDGEIAHEKGVSSIDMNSIEQSEDDQRHISEELPISKGDHSTSKSQENSDEDSLILAKPKIPPKMSDKEILLACVLSPDSEGLVSPILNFVGHIIEKAESHPSETVELILDNEEWLNIYFEVILEVKELRGHFDFVALKTYSQLIMSCVYLTIEDLTLGFYLIPFLETMFKIADKLDDLGTVSCTINLLNIILEKQNELIEFDHSAATSYWEQYKGYLLGLLENYVAVLKVVDENSQLIELLGSIGLCLKSFTLVDDFQERFYPPTKSSADPKDSLFVRYFYDIIVICTNIDIIEVFIEIIHRVISDRLELTPIVYHHMLPAFESLWYKVSGVNLEFCNSYFGLLCHFLIVMPPSVKDSKAMHHTFYACWCVIVRKAYQVKMGELPGFFSYTTLLLQGTSSFPFKLIDLFGKLYVFWKGTVAYTPEFREFDECYLLVRERKRKKEEEEKRTK